MAKQKSCYINFQLGQPIKYRQYNDYASPSNNTAALFIDSPCHNFISKRSSHSFMHYIEIIFILFIYRNSLIPKIMLKNTDNFYKTESSIFTINCQTNLIFVKGKENMSGKFCQYSTVHLQRIPKDISDYQISGKMFHYQCSTFYIYNIYMYHIYLTDPCEAIFVIGQ